MSGYHPGRLPEPKICLIITSVVIAILCNAAPSLAFESDIFGIEDESEPIVWLDLPDGWEIQSGISIGVDSDELIIQVPMDEDSPPMITMLDWPSRLIVDIPRDINAPLTEIASEFKPELSVLIDHLTLEARDTRWVLTLYMFEPLPWKQEMGIDSERIRVRFLGSVWYRLSDTSNWRLWEVRRFLPDGIQNAYFVQINPALPGMDIHVAYAGSIGAKTTTLSEFVRLTGAYGGINGGFFATGTPLGLVAINGKMVTPPMLSRPCVAFDQGGMPYIGVFKSICQAVFRTRGQLTIETINDFYNSGPVLLTPGHPERVRGQFRGLKIAIRDGYVVEKTDGDIIDFTNKDIIWDPYTASPLLQQVEVGDEVKLQYSFQGFPFEPVYIIQAGPLLVKNGKVVDDFSLGSFLEGITRGRSPRTAVATTIHGEVLLIMAEGRLSSHSLGFSLGELASLIVEVGGVDGINLDGGSSSSMYVDGDYYGLPSGGNWKPVPDAVLFGNFVDRGKDTIF